MQLGHIKKYPVFSLFLGGVAILMIGAGFYFAASRRAYKRQAGELNALTGELHRLYARDTFPAEENVLREKENLEDSVDLFNELNELARRGQKELQPMEASDFMQFLENSLRTLRGRLQGENVKFPDQYAFGFEKYAGGQLPSPGDIPRLVQQLNIIETLCEIIREASVSELVSITREVFELAPPPPESAVEGSDADKMFACQRFKVIVKGRESAIMEMLNLMASHPMFIMVTRIEISNPRQDYNAGAQPVVAVRAESAAAATPSSREPQIILGREELNAGIDLEVYQFAPSLPFKEGGSAQ